MLAIRLQTQSQNRPADELELISHVNETIGSLRRQIYLKTKLNPQMNKIDLIINNECIECMEDNKTLGDYQLKEKLEKMYIVARISQSSHHHQSPALNLNLNSSSSGVTSGGTATSGPNRIESSGGEDDDSSSSTTDECTSSQDNEAVNHHHNVVGLPNLDYELQLPSMILSLSEQYVQFLIDLADFGCRIRNAQIKECTRGILDLLPIAKHTGERIKQLCKDCAQLRSQAATSSGEPAELALDKFYSNCTQTQCWYHLKVTHALLLPAMHQYNPDETKQFQVSC